MRLRKLTVMASFVLAFCLTGCVSLSSDGDASIAGDSASRIDAIEQPHEYLPVLNLDALSGETATLEGASGGLMSHRWNVKGEVIELDAGADVAIVSVDSDDDYLQYLNSPIAVSLEEMGLEPAVGDEVQVMFLPPGSEETVVHPSGLTILSKAQ